MRKPLLAITMGDPTGVGPEIIAKAWGDPRIHRACRPLVVGNCRVLSRAVRLLGLDVEVQEIDSPHEAAPSPTALPCLPAGDPAAAQAPPATMDPQGGRAAHAAIALAADLALAQRVDGMVTAPLNKAALNAAGFNYPGHTELLADLCGVSQTAMMLYVRPGSVVCGPAGLGVVHATLHCALSDVPKRLTAEKILKCAHQVDDVMGLLAPHSAPPARPRIGVCALNPHAGECGLFGDEESRIIAPAVSAARRAGLSIEGPLPADSLFPAAAAGQYEALIAMYHDQGHVAIKLLGMQRAVNITLGLPIVRTSVAHGTAFDRAWQGRAEAAGMVEAICVAAQLARRRFGESSQPAPVAISSAISAAN